MNCRRVEQLLSDYLERLVSPRTADAITAHLKDCPVCRGRREQYRALQAELRGLAEQLPSPSPGIERRSVTRWMAEAGGRRVPAGRVVTTVDRGRGNGFADGGWRLAAVAGAVMAGALLAALDIALVHGPRGPSWKEAGFSRPSGTGAVPVPVPHAEARGYSRGVPPGRGGVGGPRRVAAKSGPDTNQPPSWERGRPARIGSDMRAGRPRSQGRRSPWTGSSPASTLALRFSVGNRGEASPSPGGTAEAKHSLLGMATGRGAGDLRYLNGTLLRGAARWASVPSGNWDQIERQVRRRVLVREDFVTLPFPRLAMAAGGQRLSAAGIDVDLPYPRLPSAPDRQIVGAVEEYKRAAAVIDPRLAKEVTLAVKAMALCDLCDRLRAETGIHLAAGRSVSDEKVTVFCEKLPLREVMRQLSRPFGYTWLRTRSGFGVRRSAFGVGGDKVQGRPVSVDPNAERPTPNPGYRYELVQDLKSQLLEEELRNRDRNAALLSLDREMDAYRQYLALSPDEALARARTAAPEEKKRLENLAQYGWGPVQMYFRLAPRDLAALRAGQKITFSAEPRLGEQPLPSDIARGVLRSLRDTRIRNRDGRFTVGTTKEIPEEEATDGLPPVSVPEARALVTLRIDPSELGQFKLDGGSGVRIVTPTQTTGPTTSDVVATGISPPPPNQESAVAGVRLAGDPSLRRRVSVRPRSSCGDAGRQATADSPAKPGGSATPNPAAVDDGQPRSGASRKVTSADVLEALHHASGLPIVADYYTRLYPLDAVLAQNEPLFDALNHLGDAMRLGWNKEGNWLQFRSATYYDDRLKEVPNRLLARWSASRRQRGGLSLDDLIEITGLSEPQLDSKIIAEGVKECFGLAEWELARNAEFRPHLRFLAEFTPAQRQEAMSAAGLRFTQMSLAQQQQFITSLRSQLRSLEELTNAALRVEYTQPGAFQWGGQEEPAPAPVQERTREAALLAARRVDPQVDPAQIVPTELAVTVFYSWGEPQVGSGSLLMRVTPNYTRARADHHKPRP